MTDQAERKQWAEDTFAWFQALCAAGFTDEQATEILAASIGRAIIQTPTQQTPEMAELMQRMGVFLSRQSDLDW